MSYFIILWGCLMIGTLGIGGFFMFRKFLKQLPKEDGKSDMYWQYHYIEQTKHMWKEPELQLLDEFVAPVPELFRDVAKQTIAGKIGEVALTKNADEITKEIMIEGYIVGTPKRDHRFLRKLLQEKILMSDHTNNFSIYRKKIIEIIGKSVIINKKNKKKHDNMLSCFFLCNRTF